VGTWWQTETGCIMIAPIPNITPTKPGSCTRPLPGIEADIVDDHGNSVTRPETGGYLVIRRPWPAMLRTIWGDNDRYLSTYWEKFQNRFYVAGDSAHRDKDGYFWIMGRIDDVLNVAGHRLGTMEIESALVSHPRVAEAAVVGRPHEIKGEAVFAYVVCRGQRPEEVEKLTKELRDWVAQELGAIARPDDIRFADNLPKTRSGKIMRRLLRSIARGEEITQDVSTLENPAILEQLRGTDTVVDATPAPSARASATKKGPASPAPAAKNKTSRAKTPAKARRKASVKSKLKSSAAKTKTKTKAASRRLGASVKRVARKAASTLKARPKRAKAKAPTRVKTRAKGKAKKSRR
jgi:hypothetical protein